MKKIAYLLVEMSSGDVPAELDNALVFCRKEDAVKKLRKSYKDLIKDLKQCGSIEEADADDEEYTVTFCDEDSTTTYHGEIREIEIL